MHGGGMLGGVHTLSWIDARVSGEQQKQFTYQTHLHTYLHTTYIAAPQSMHVEFQMGLAVFCLAYSPLSFLFILAPTPRDDPLPMILALNSSHSSSSLVASPSASAPIHLATHWEFSRVVRSPRFPPPSRHAWEL